jgi:dTDP-4-dehydrorhamnose reductase
MIHVIGASGYIGKNLENYFRLNSVKDLILYSDISSEKYIELNLLNLSDKTFEPFKKNDIVIFLAAISSPDLCENNYEFAKSINIDGTVKFIDACLKREVNVLFFSSDVVYGFNTGINDENTKPNPHGNYAKMKFYIEEKYKYNDHFKVFRLSYVLSEEDKFIDYINQCIRNKIIPEVFNGFKRNVILIEDVLKSVYNITQNFNLIKSPIINICGEESLSRVDLANYFNRQHKFDYKIIDIPIQMLKSRPNTIITKSLYIEKILGRKPKKIMYKKGEYL